MPLIPQFIGKKTKKFAFFKKSNFENGNFYFYFSLTPIPSGSFELRKKVEEMGRTEVSFSYRSYLLVLPIGNSNAQTERTTS